MVGGLSPAAESEWEHFGRRWLPTLVAIIVRTVHDAALAFDISTETLAAASTEWARPIVGDDGLVELLALAARTLDVAADRQSVPALERRRHRRSQPHRLTIDEQQAALRLAEAPLDLPPAAQAAVESFAQQAPPPWAVRRIRLSGLVEAEPLPHNDESRVDDA